MKELPSPVGVSTLFVRVGIAGRESTTSGVAGNAAGVTPSEVEILITHTWFLFVSIFHPLCFVTFFDQLSSYASAFFWTLAFLLYSLLRSAFLFFPSRLLISLIISELVSTRDCFVVDLGILSIFSGGAWKTFTCLCGMMPALTSGLLPFFSFHVSVGSCGPPSCPRRYAQVAYTGSLEPGWPDCSMRWYLDNFRGVKVPSMA